jgi:CBS domain-containing protein
LEEAKVKVSKLVGQKKVVTISPEKKLSELVKMLCEFKIGAVVVSSNGVEIEGIVSERDIVKHLNTNYDVVNMTVEDIMTREVVVCKIEDSVADLIRMMTNGRFRHCPVVDDQGGLISIVSIGDVVKAHISDIADERDALNSYVHN